MRSFLFLTLVLFSSPAMAYVEFDWATVGNPGNAATGGRGQVNYTYRISKHEVTNDQYAEFLNKVAVSDPHDLFSPSMEITRDGDSGGFSYNVLDGFETHPIHSVSYFDAMRFVNWLNNGQPTGVQDEATTESGSYTIDTNKIRNAGATYFIPNEEEWYKAAYHDPRIEAVGGPGIRNYWRYPTLSNSIPIAEAPPGDENSGNFRSAGTTSVGAYKYSGSFYGTFDQAGNVSEWHESPRTSHGVFRGGNWMGASGHSVNAVAFVTDFGSEAMGMGFRVASVPEPNGLCIVGIVILSVVLRRSRSSLRPRFQTP